MPSHVAELGSMKSACLTLVVLACGIPFFACGGTDATPATNAAPTTPAEKDGGNAKDAASSNDAGETCAAPNVVCSGACTDTAMDAKNCGACGTVCPSGKACRASTCVDSISFAASKIFLGDSDRTGAQNSAAWKDFGENIDGLSSTNASTDVCKRVAGASPSAQQDGTDGIDNSWGHNIVPFLTPFIDHISDKSNLAILSGARTAMLEVSGWNPPADIAVAPTSFFFTEQSSTPKWDGTDMRSIAAEWLSGSAAKGKFPQAKITGLQFTSGDPTGTILLAIPGALGLTFPISRAHVTMKISDDLKTASQGTLSGVVATADLLAAFDVALGTVAPQICGTPTMESIKASLRQASDILKDGTQDPSKDCDGVSIGIGFEATAVIAGAGAPAITPPTGCP